VNHRHLLPNEIDLLLDDEVGFGVAPLRDHVRECVDCRARLDEARVIADALADLPHLAPSFNLANRVMAQVPVFVPWHVAARDAVTRYLPHSRPGRIAAAAAAGSVGAVLSAACVWLATRDDLVALVAGIAGDRIRAAASGSMNAAFVSLLGPDALAQLQHNGLSGVWLAAGGFLLAAAASALGLRAIAASTRPRA
jgi:hypothetical protein